ncbi:neuronal acetylcholine receptor subunit alpha-9-like isoform X2 [Stylophora pistillata]|uniref:neuronal acetylcholine receptor subunit alpha-9-like isoform X2 n=1 Tax=Stylophora pistillata TaxID=50429 RepID=UPI000C041FF2|nr:neuronal acetylcholine receptor subunit alpha-9-like isoform X2 [Stylophora pistillata]
MHHRCWKLHWVFSRIDCSECHAKFVISHCLFQDEVEQLVRMSLWYRLTWQDRFLMWSPSQYGNLTRINLPVDAIWTPSVGLLNSLESGFAPIFESADGGLSPLAEIRYDGQIKIAVPTILSISCIMDMTMYPFDIQRCKLKFGTWAYTNKDLKFSADFKTSILAESKEAFASSAGWSVMEYRAVDQHDNDTNASPSVAFTMQLKRHTTYYIVILFLPCFSNAMLTLLVFLLPTETGERIGVGINTLFIMWVNYLRALNGMPKSPNLPVFCKFYYFVMFECVCAIAISCLLISFYHMNVHIEPPDWVKTHILDRMAWIVFLRSSVKHRQRTAEEFKKEAEQFRSRFGGKTYHKITIGLNLFVDNSLKEFETFWRREIWRLVSLVLERFFTYVLLFSVLISFFVFAATVR